MYKNAVLVVAVFLLSATPSSGQALYNQFSAQLNDFYWLKIKETFAEAYYGDVAKARDLVLNIGGLIDFYDYVEQDTGGDVPISTMEKIIYFDQQPHNSGDRFFSAYEFMAKYGLRPPSLDDIAVDNYITDQTFAYMNQIIDFQIQCTNSWNLLGDEGKQNYNNSIDVYCEERKWNDEIRSLRDKIEALGSSPLELNAHFQLNTKLRDLEEDKCFTKIIDDYGNMQNQQPPNWITNPSPKTIAQLQEWTTAEKCIHKRIAVDESFDMNNENLVSEVSGLHFFVTIEDGDWRTVELTTSFEMEVDLCFEKYQAVNVYPDCWYKEGWWHILEFDQEKYLNDDWSLCKQDNKTFFLLGQNGLVNARIEELIVVSKMNFSMALSAEWFQSLETYDPNNFRLGMFCKGKPCLTNGNTLIGFDNSPSFGMYSSSTNEVNFGWLFIQHALEDLLKAVRRLKSIPDTIAAIGCPALEDPTSFVGSDASTAISAVAHILGAEVTFYDGIDEIRQFFNELSAGEVDPAVIWIPGDNTGGLDAEEIEIMRNYANDLNFFATEGGGILSHGSVNSQKWLFEDLIPYAQFNSACSREGATGTNLGSEWWPSITEEDLQTGNCFDVLRSDIGCSGLLDTVAKDANGNAFMFTTHGGFTNGRECGVYPAPSPGPTPPPSQSPTGVPSGVPTPPPTAIPTPDGQPAVEPCDVYEISGHTGPIPFINGLWQRTGTYNDRDAYFNPLYENGLWLFWYPEQRFWLISNGLGSTSVHAYGRGVEIPYATWEYADTMLGGFFVDENVVVKCAPEWCDVDLTGSVACGTNVNGNYIAQPDLYNGRPLYRLAGENIWIYYKPSEGKWLVVENNANEVDLENANELAQIDDSSTSLDRIDTSDNNLWQCVSNNQQYDVNINIMCADGESTTTSPGTTPIEECILNFPGRIGFENLEANGVFVPDEYFPGLVIPGTTRKMSYYDELSEYYLYYEDSYRFWLIGPSKGDTNVWAYCEGADLDTCIWNMAGESIWDRMEDLSCQCEDWCDITISNCNGCANLHGLYKLQDDLQNGRPYYYSRTSEFYIFYNRGTSEEGWYFSRTIDDVDGANAKILGNVNSPDIAINNLLVEMESGEFEQNVDVSVQCDRKKKLLLAKQSYEMKNNYASGKDLKLDITKFLPKRKHRTIMLQVDESDDDVLDITDTTTEDVIKIEADADYTMTVVIDSEVAYIMGKDAPWFEPLCNVECDGIPNRSNTCS